MHVFSRSLLPYNVAKKPLKLLKWRFIRSDTDNGTNKIIIKNLYKMKQNILQHKDPETLGKKLIDELQKLNANSVIVHTCTFFDHIDEYFKAIILYHE